MAFGRYTYGDETDKLAREMQYTIEIYHLASGRTISFKAFITDFSDSYQSNWATEEVYGRMDPVATFQNTKRTIDIAWDVIAGNKHEAESAQDKCQQLLAMLYPSYEDSGTGDNAGNIMQAPLLRVKFSNLMSVPMARGTAQDSGLVGFFNGFDYRPNFEVGVYAPEPGVLYPKLVSLSGQFQVLHQFPVGYSQTRDFRTRNFPYGHTDTHVDRASLQEYIDATTDEQQQAAGQSFEHGGFSGGIDVDADGEPTWSMETPVSFTDRKFTIGSDPEDPTAVSILNPEEEVKDLANEFLLGGF